MLIDFRFCKSSTLADLEIFCGERSWKVNRFALAFQSGVMLRQLDKGPNVCISSDHWYGAQFIES